MSNTCRISKPVEAVLPTSFTKTSQRQKNLETLQFDPKRSNFERSSSRLCGCPRHRMVLDLLLVVPVPVPVAPLQGRCRGRRGIGPRPGAVTAGLAGTATGWGGGGQGAGGRTVRLVGHCFASDHQSFVIRLRSTFHVTSCYHVHESLEFHFILQKNVLDDLRIRIKNQTCRDDTSNSTRRSSTRAPA